MNEKVPAISLIVPMYNAEKYIEQSLNSVLSQTFKDFEIIVVDDCSTDQSVNIVEGIIERNSGEDRPKIHLIKNNKNAGGAAVPRNIGMRFSRGKYIAFLDNDDMFTNNAFAELYKTAEETGADVLHAQRFLVTRDVRSKVDSDTTLSIMSWEKAPFVTTPEPVPYDIGERIRMFVQMRLLWNVWNKLFRRDFIMRNQLEFPNVKIIDDMIFCFKCFCLAENYVRIPNIFNLYRLRDDSQSHHFESWQEYFHQSINTIKEGVKLSNEFMDGIKFFNQHPEFKYMVTDFIVQSHLNQTIMPCNQQPPHVIMDVLRKELSSELDNNTALVSYLFNLVNIYHLKLKVVNQTVTFLQNKLNTVNVS